MKREKFTPETIIDEDVPAFMGALAQASKDGKKEFKFGDKTYKVNLKKDVADKITKNMDEAQTTDLEKANILTPDEWDEVQTFKNFNKKDWKWNAIQKKFVRLNKVKESTDLEEAISWWTVTITKKAGKLFKGQTVDVKASNSAEAIKKGIKQMKGNPILVPSGSVDAVLGESVDLEEAVKWWTVTITKKAGKLFKGQTVDVKASNSAEAIKKGLKQMKADPITVPSGSVDAVLGESVDLDEATDLESQLIDNLSEASASDYAKLSDSDLKDLLNIFRNVGRAAAQPIIRAIRVELNRRSISEETELEEAARPFKDLEKAWIRANDDKREKLIAKHNLKPIISNVRPGAIKLGPLNSLNAKGKQDFTMAGLDADGELIFISNNPTRIHYPSNVKDRPKGEEMKESVSLETLRLRRIVELSVNESDTKTLDAFINESSVNITWRPSKIVEAYKKYIIEADYQLYHSTFTAAAQAATDLAKKKGFEVDEDDWFNQVSTGPKKPGKGKTNRYVVKVTKGGKETKKRLAFQVYGMDSGKYELNAYVESTQIQEAAGSTMDQVNAIVSDKQAMKIGGKMIDMQTASVIAQVYNKVNDATKKKMENEKIEKLVNIAQRVMAMESAKLEEATDTVDINTPTPDAAKRLAKKLANKWSELRSLTPKGKSVTVPNERAYIRYIESQPEFEGIAESTDLEEAVVYRDIRHALELLKTTPDAVKLRDVIAKKDQDAKISSSDLNKAKEVFAKMSDKDKASIEKKKNDKYFPKFGVKALTEESTDLDEAAASVKMIIKALKLKGGNDAEALIKKLSKMDQNGEAPKSDVEAATKLLKGQITKFVKESDKDLDAKDLKSMISDPDPSRFNQYGGKDKYIKMLKDKLDKLKK